VVGVVKSRLAVKIRMYRTLMSFVSISPPVFKGGYEPTLKMVTNSFGNRNFMQPTRRLSMHSRWALFFSLCGWGGGSCKKQTGRKNKNVSYTYDICVNKSPSL
jgi:hypothetical protein